jgi:hypothetical protein
MNHNLFVSYSRVDSEFALRLVRDLRTHDVEVWFDQTDIPPGANWDDEIERALDQAKIMIVILSEASGHSQNVKNEIAHALEQGKQVVPVLLSKGAVPLRITRLQREDFSGDYRLALAKLTRRLQGESKTSSLQAITTEDVQQQAREAAARLSAESIADIHGARENEPGVRVSEPGALGALTATARPSSRSPWKSQRALFLGLGLAAVAGAAVVMLRASERPTKHEQELAAQTATHTPESSPVPPATPSATSAPPSPPSPQPAPSPTEAASTKVPDHLPQPTPEPTPPAASRGALLCSDRQFGGVCEQITKNVDLKKSKVGKATVSSLRLGSCSAVTVCSEINLTGKCITYSVDQPDLSHIVGADNSASSIECLVGSTGTALLCPQPAIGGRCEKLGTTARLFNSRIGKDTVASFQLGTCHAVKLCSDIDFGGECQTFTHNRSDLNDTKVGNKRASSIECLDAATP